MNKAQGEVRIMTVNSCGYKQNRLSVVLRKSAHNDSRLPPALPLFFVRLCIIL